MGPKRPRLRLGIIGLVHVRPPVPADPVSGWTSTTGSTALIARAAVAAWLVCAAILAWRVSRSTTLADLYAVAALLGAPAPLPTRLGASPPICCRARSFPSDRIVLNRLQSGRSCPALGAISMRRAGRALCRSAGLSQWPSSWLLMIPPVARPRLLPHAEPVETMVEACLVAPQRLVLWAHSLDLFRRPARRRDGDAAVVFLATCSLAGPTGLGHLRAAPAVERH